MISSVIEAIAAVEELDVVDDLTADQAVVRSEVAIEGLFELGDLRTHPALGQLGQNDRVPLTGDERLDDLT